MNTNGHAGALMPTNEKDVDDEPQQPRLYEASTWRKAISLFMSPFVIPFDYLLNTLIDPSRKSNHFLTGGYAPITVPTPTSAHTSVGNPSTMVALEVIACTTNDAALPIDLQGQFFRNGPNPQFYKENRFYHWFDGDGMVHAIKMENGKAFYTNHLIETTRLKEERRTDGLHYQNIGEFSSKHPLLRLVWNIIKRRIGYVENPGEFKLGTANTSLEFHDRRLLAVHEASLPYELYVKADGAVRSIGYHDYAKMLKKGMTAHPKVCAVTGDLCFFFYNLQTKPYITYYCANRDGVLVKTIPITIPYPTMQHDFCITENYAIICNFPMVFDKMRVANNQFPFFIDKEQPTRFGLLPRVASDESSIRWFESGPTWMVHSANAWETHEGDETMIYLVGCRMMDLDFDLNDMTKDGNNVPYVWKLNVTTGAVQEEYQLFKEPRRGAFDFPRVHPGRIGQPTRYTWVCGFATGGKVERVLKLDMTALPTFKTSPPNVDLDVIKPIPIGQADGLCGEIVFGKGFFSGECVFVPRTLANGAPLPEEADEDEGYLMTFMYNENDDTSEFWIMDAKTMASEPLVRMALPHRVPYGFHGIWVPQAKLECQRAYS